MRSSRIVVYFLIILIIFSSVYAHRLSKNKQLDFVIRPNERIDCYPDSISPFSNYSKESCLARNCLFDDQANRDEIQCYLSPNYGYILQDSPIEIENGLRLKLKRNIEVNSMFEQVIENVFLDVQYYTNEIIRFKFYDADRQRYEVPIELKSPLDKVSSQKYEFLYSKNSSRDELFSFKIKRRNTNVVLFDTSIGGLVLNNQFLQIVTRLQSSNVYGFGENNHDSLKHNVQQRNSWGIFNRDQGTHWDDNANHYGSHPFYLVMEENSNEPSGEMHGVLLLNSNAMDYSFDSHPSLTIRTIGGILDFFVFLGPKPEQVIEQYTWLIGRSMLPPYWSLGFQLSRWEYSNLTHMKMINQRNRQLGIPLDVQHADIDYMDKQKDFTVDQVNYRGLKEYFQELHQQGLRTIIILDPGIANSDSYQPLIDGKENDVFIKWDDGQNIIKGVCWPGEVLFPGFN